MALFNFELKIFFYILHLKIQYVNESVQYILGNNRD